jgi:methyl-accepting chemotaxis protein
VEAARAGEAGAGFAVVSVEVRNLALRAADAARNTADLIESTVKKIKNGSELVAKTNEAFALVARGAKKVGELLGEISAASSEQSQGIEQINNAVLEMDMVVQRNAACAEETSSAAEEMNAQAEQMKEFVAELRALVRGGKNGKGTVIPKNNILKRITREQIAPVTRNSITRPEQSLKAFLKPANGKGVKPAVQRKVKEIRPDQLIPMGEGDFKEF